MAEDKPPMKVKDDEDVNPLVSGSAGNAFGVEDEPKTRKVRSDAGKPRGPRGSRRSGTLSKKISSAIAMVAAGVATVDPFDSAIILHNADRLGNAWAPVVEQNPRIKQFFESLEKGGVWGSAIFATMSVALPIVAHHMPHVLPPPLKMLAASMLPPDMLQKMAQTQQGHAAANPIYNPNGTGA